MDTIDSAAPTTRRMPHHRMIHEWRAGRALPVSPDNIGYVTCGGAWWWRTGASWETIAEGPLTVFLSERLRQVACPGAAVTEPSRLRDPWTIARNRRRTGAACGRPAAFMPMRATEPRPYPPAVCRPV